MRAELSIAFALFFVTGNFAQNFVYTAWDTNWGQDLFYLPTNDVTACTNKCASTTNCRAVVYSTCSAECWGKSTPMQWLQSSCRRTEVTPFSVPSAVSSSFVYTGWDVNWGADLFYLPTNNVPACTSMCASIANCRAVVYSTCSAECWGKSLSPSVQWLQSTCRRTEVMPFRIPSIGCSSSVRVVAGDSCWALATNNGVSGGLNGFMALNPGLNCSALQVGSLVCVNNSTCGFSSSIPSPSAPGSALISKAEFETALTVNGYPAPSDEQYSNFSSRASPSNNIATRTEAAMFLANILQESDGLRAKSEYNPQPGAYQYPALDVPGQSYFGRGYMQLTWSYNYKAASQALYGDDRLLLNAGQVASSDPIAWDTAFWFWNANVHSKAGIAQGQFGTSIDAINGALECRVAGNIAAANRFKMYSNIFCAWGLPGTPVEIGCSLHN